MNLMNRYKCSGWMSGLSFSLTSRSSTRGPGAVERHSLRFQLARKDSHEEQKVDNFNINSKCSFCVRGVQMKIKICHLEPQCRCRGQRVSSPRPRLLLLGQNQCSLLHLDSTGWTCRRVGRERITTTLAGTDRWNFKWNLNVYVRWPGVASRDRQINTYSQATHLE